MSNVCVSEPVTDLKVPIKRISPGDLSYFFGYYDKCPWDASGRFLLATRMPFCDRPPHPGEPLTIGMFDLPSSEPYVRLDETLAWSWQQGTMLQWLGPAHDRDIIYNAVEAGQYVSVIRDVHNGDTRTLPRPVYAVSRDGAQAVSADFDRINRLRPGYGYCALPEKYASEAAPDQAGIYHVDLNTGANRLIFNLAQLAANQTNDRFNPPQHHWVNHLEFNPSASRFLFLHRWTNSDVPRSTRLYTAKPDGSELRLILDTEKISHFCWRDDETILVWAKRSLDGEQLNYQLVDAVTGQQEVLADGVLTEDGHCTYSPDGKWILTDTYPDRKHYRTLILYRVTDGKRIDVGGFYSPPQLEGEYRCDLHPRFNRDGTAVCIDSAHEGTRQLYVLDVGEMVAG